MPSMRRGSLRRAHGEGTEMSDRSGGTWGNGEAYVAPDANSTSNSNAYNPRHSTGYGAGSAQGSVPGVAPDFTPGAVYSPDTAYDPGADDGAGTSRAMNPGSDSTASYVSSAPAPHLRHLHIRHLHIRLRRRRPREPLDLARAGDGPAANRRIALRLPPPG